MNLELILEMSAEGIPRCLRIAVVVLIYGGLLAVGSSAAQTVSRYDQADSR